MDNNLYTTSVGLSELMLELTTFESELFKEAISTDITELQLINDGKDTSTFIESKCEDIKNKIIEIGTLEPKTNIARNKENLKVKNINKNEKVESVKGKLPSTGISQINTFIAGLFALIIAGVLTIFKRKKR